MAARSFFTISSTSSGLCLPIPWTLRSLMILQRSKGIPRRMYKGMFCILCMTARPRSSSYRQTRRPLQAYMALLHVITAFCCPCSMVLNRITNSINSFSSHCQWLGFLYYSQAKSWRNSHVNIPKTYQHRCSVTIRLIARAAACCSAVSLLVKSLP